MSVINFPILYIPDPIKGRPLFNGQIFVGEPDLDPEIVGNQKQLNVVEEDGTVIAVGQPFVLSAGGVPVYNGNPVRLDVEGNYSFKILNKLSAQTYYIENVFAGQPITQEAFNTYGIQHYTLAEAIELSTAVEGQIVQITDRNNAQYKYVLASGVTPNTFDVVQCDAPIETLALQIILKINMSLRDFGGVVGADNSDALNAAQIVMLEGSTLSVPSGTLSEVQTERDNINFISEGGIITLLPGPAPGIGWRLGKRGPSTDDRDDNLPSYDGKKGYFDADDYSPAIVDYPRYKNITLKGFEFNVTTTSQSHPLEFWRIDGGGVDFEITQTGDPVLPGHVRFMFCTQFDNDKIITPDNANAVFSQFYFWSYGFRTKLERTGNGSTHGTEHKGCRNFFIDSIEGESINAIGPYVVDFGYGFNDITIGSITAVNAGVRFKSSEEFDQSGPIKINDLTIKNPTGNNGDIGLNLVNITGLTLDSYDIEAPRPVEISKFDFYSFSSDTAVVPSLNTDSFVFDGNYDYTEVDGGLTKYFEYRSYPMLHNSTIGKGVLNGTGVSKEHFRQNVAGGTGPILKSGKVVLVDAISARGFEESKRVSFNSSQTRPFAINDCELGEMEIINTIGTPAASPIFFAGPFDNSNINVNSKLASGLYKFNFAFDSEIQWNSNLLTTTSNRDIFLLAANNVKLKATTRIEDTPIELAGTTAFKDGIVGLTVEGDFVYPDGTGEAPLIRTELDSVNPDDQWPQSIAVIFDNCRLYTLDGSATEQTQHRIMQHEDGIPTGVDQFGGGYAASNSFHDSNIPFRRRFTDAVTTNPPTEIPNRVGELAQNATTGDWWQAITPTVWSKLV